MTCLTTLEFLNIDIFLVYITHRFKRNTTARVFTENPTQGVPATLVNEGTHCGIGPTFDGMHDFGLCVC